MKTAVLLLLIGSTLMSKTYSQDLSSHRWNDRLLMVLAEDSSLKDLEKQVERIRSDKDGIHERKLVVYQVLPDRYKPGLEAKEWIESDKLYNRLKKTRSGLETLLIGLDGGIKARYEGPVSLATIYSRIDAMPMRQRELEGR